MKPSPKEIAEKRYLEHRQEKIFNGSIIVSKKLTNEEKEANRFNQNYNEIKSLLIEVGNKLFSENRIRSMNELKELRNLINDYIAIIRKKAATIKESAFFEGNKCLIKRNIENDIEAIKSLESDLKVVERKIEDFEREDGVLKNHLLQIKTNANKDKILDFWLKLQGDNEKGEQYWNSKEEIIHFVNQNFFGFTGVDEIKMFTPNMNKSELNHTTWTFFDKYGIMKSKKQYENLLRMNFLKFKYDRNIYSNIKDQYNKHLKSILE